MNQGLSSSRTTTNPGPSIAKNHHLEPMKPAVKAKIREPPSPKHPIRSFGWNAVGIKMNERGITARTILQKPSLFPAL